MAKGGGSASLLLVLALLIAFASQCFQVEGRMYEVGGNQGWGLTSKWQSKPSRAKAGDILYFKYSPGAHNVVSVSSKDFKSCRITGRVKQYNSGNDKIVLKKGWNYFICSFPGHCGAGMKVSMYAI